MCPVTTGCGGKVQGNTYQGNGGVVKIEFKSGGKAYLSAGPATATCTYSENGKKVNMICEGDKTVFTVEDDGALQWSSRRLDDALDRKELVCIWARSTRLFHPGACSVSASFPRSYIRWPHLPSCLILIAFDCMTSGSLTAQTTNPAYIHDFPSVDRVKAEIKGADPTDTLARQVAVFTYLPQIVQRMKAPRGYRSPLTPDEQRVIAVYDLAAYQLSQDFAKTHTPEEAKAFAQLHGRYEMDSKFYDDWYKRLVTPNVSRQYDAANATEAAHYKAHVDQQIRENDAIRAQQQQAQAQANRGFVRNDPGTVAVRRCIELGGNELSCVGKGLMTGLMGTDGMSDSDKAFFGMEDKAGLLLNGLFKSSGSKLACASAATSKPRSTPAASSNPQPSPTPSPSAPMRSKSRSTSSLAPSRSP